MQNNIVLADQMSRASDATGAFFQGVNEGLIQAFEYSILAFTVMVLITTFVIVYRRKPHVG